MTTSVDLKLLFEEYVSQVRNMQLATVEDGVPWICTVYFVADEVAFPGEPKQAFLINSRLA